MERFWQLLRERTVLLDGALGTELIREGLPQGACPESWNIENPNVIKKIHQSYFDAGADAVTTNSFGGNRLKLASHKLEERCFEVNLAAAKLAIEVKPEGKFVAGCIGPTGKFLKPQGEYEEKDFEEAFAAQAVGLTEGGVDFLLLETMYDLREALCALKGARSVSHLPVFASMTFNRTPRGFFTLMGNSIRQCLQELGRNSALVLGANCTLNSANMADLIKEMRKETSLPLLAQPNSGQPVLSPEDKVTYSQDMEDYIRYFPLLVANGANIIGGCCGTNPEYIRRMAKLIKKT